MSTSTVHEQDMFGRYQAISSEPEVGNKPTVAPGRKVRKEGQGRKAKEGRPRKEGEGRMAKEGRPRKEGQGRMAKEGRPRKEGEGRMAKEGRPGMEGRPRKEGQGRKEGHGRKAKEGRKEGRTRPMQQLTRPSLRTDQILNGADLSSPRLPK